MTHQGRVFVCYLFTSYHQDYVRALRKAQGTWLIRCFLHCFMVGQLPCKWYPDSLNQIAGSSNRLITNLMDSNWRSMRAVIRIKKKSDNSYLYDWHSAPVYSHKDLSLCLTCRRCIPNAFLQPTPHHWTIASLLSFSCLASVNSTLLTTESVLTTEEFQKLTDIRTACDFQEAS